MEKQSLQSEPLILQQFAHTLGTTVVNRKLEIPERFGKGYCKGFVFNKHIRMLILNFELKENLLVENPEIHTLGKMILFKFQHVFPAIKNTSADKPVTGTPSVLIATSTLNTDKVVPIDTHTATVNIEVDAAYLNGLFDLSKKTVILESLLQNAQPLLFEQIIYPSLQDILNEIISEAVDSTFELFFLRVKAEELVCRLLMELEKREEKHLYDLNASDIQTIYQIKEQILSHLEIPPVIKELAEGANMSPTKLKRLFKQVFGNSIFSYYQGFRMKEAARLLREEKQSVSDTGYQLGFTNLSHFSRVFNEHTGMKPKQYSKS